MGRKWKVIIVDDEYYIGQLIAKLLPWDQYNLENAGVFDSSEKALEKILEDTPDIVITDIRMPRITGLDLIRKTCEMGKKTRFIITSGYREFDYAQQAMKYGVDNYILKPVRRESLEEAISHVCGLLEKDAHVEDIEQEIHRVSDQQSRTRRNSYLRSAVEQGVGKKFDPEALRKDGDGYLCLDLKLDYFDSEKAAENQEELVTRNVFRIVGNNLEEFCDEILTYGGRNLNLYVLLIHEKDREREIRKKLDIMLAEISQYLQDIDLYHVTVGVSREKTEASQIPDAAGEAAEAVSGRLVYGTERILARDDMPPYRKNAAAQILERHKAEIARSIDTFDRSLLTAETERCFHDLVRDGIPNTREFTALAETVITYFQECAGNENPASERQAILDRLDQCSDRGKFCRTLTDSLGQILERSKQASEQQNLKPVRIAKAYIEDHYDQKLTLEDIAREAALSPIYLGTLFKKETGQTIGSYLTGVRMERAKKLLVDTNCTVAAIGMQVGYKDPKYFSQTFTKYVGIKPNLYRKLHA